jgi:ethanolamine-phosphate cytidylyltransferase
MTTRQYFIDGCFDGYHYGHVNAILQSKMLCDTLVLGTHTDKEMSAQKNIPLFDFEDRCYMLSHCKYIDQFVGAVPYVVTIQTVHKYQCSKYLHGDETIITKNNENGITVPLDCYITYKVTEGISTSNLLLRLYQYTNKLPLSRNENTAYLMDILTKMKAYVDLSNNKKIYVIHEYDMLCPAHLKQIHQCKRDYPDHKIIAVIKNDYAGDINIFNELEREITLRSITLIDDVLIYNDTVLDDMLEDGDNIIADLSDKKCKYYMGFDKCAYISKLMEKFDQLKHKLVKLTLV